MINHIRLKIKTSNISIPIVISMSVKSYLLFHNKLLCYNKRMYMKGIHLLYSNLVIPMSYRTIN